MREGPHGDVAMIPAVDRLARSATYLILIDCDLDNEGAADH